MVERNRPPAGALRTTVAAGVAKDGIGVIEDTSFSIIIIYLRCFVEIKCFAYIPDPEGALPSSHVLVQFRACQLESSCYYFCASPGHGWRVRSRIDVSVTAVGYRVFVFAAPPFLVAGNRSTGGQGAVSFDAVSPARGDASINS